MNIEQINKLTRSQGITSPNPVYRVTQLTYGVFETDFDNDPHTTDFGVVELNEGDLICVSGCRKKGGSSLYLVDGNWTRINNAHTVHYANAEYIEV